MHIIFSTISNIPPKMSSYDMQGFANASLLHKIKILTFSTPPRSAHHFGKPRNGSPALPYTSSSQGITIIVLLNEYIQQREREREQSRKAV